MDDLVKKEKSEENESQTSENLVEVGDKPEEGKVDDFIKVETKTKLDSDIQLLKDEINRMSESNKQMIEKLTETNQELVNRNEELINNYNRIKDKVDSFLPEIIGEEDYFERYNSGTEDKKKEIKERSYNLLKHIENSIPM